ncbi:MAG TPA: polyprenyl synthetase family protein [Polyangiaceae bacterium]|nr:polyprenyl synthetase family protein [Polyangiaceae bacterium]
MKRPPKKRTSLAPSLRPEPPVENVFLALLSSVQKKVDARLGDFLEQRLAQASSLGPEVKEMVAALGDLSRRGGKRLRPALLVTGYRAVSRRESSAALDAGVALELLQSYFLIHDDWMDGDLVRRGGPSVHAVLSRSLRDEHKGAASAILAGDYAAALALDVLTRIRLPRSTSAALFGAFAEMQLSAVAGQQIDLVGKARDIEAAYELKTGSYTVYGPLRMGAILAGGSPRLLSKLERLSRPLGVGFQLRDDLLSAFGDPKRTGKPLGNDLKAGKRTLLLAESLRRARGKDRVALASVVGNARAKDSVVKAALEVMDSCGARAWVESRVAELAAEARSELGAGISSEGNALLEGAISALTERRA